VQHNIYRILANMLENIHLFRRLLLQKMIPCKKVHLMQLPILNYIIWKEGCTQVEISKTLHVSPASIALSTKRLQKAGFLKKEVDPKNLRRNVLTITSKGREIANQCREVYKEIDAKMFEGFSEEDLSAFEKYIDKALYNLSGDEGRKLNPLTRMALLNQIKLNNKGKMEEENG